MEKKKWERFILVSDIDNLLTEKYPNKLCPKCNDVGIQAAQIERQYDERSEEYVLCAFVTVCNKCGYFGSDFDNRRYDKNVRPFLT